MFLCILCVLWLSSLSFTFLLFSIYTSSEDGYDSDSGCIEPKRNILNPNWKAYLNIWIQPGVSNKYKGDIVKKKRGSQAPGECFYLCSLQ